MSMKEKKRQSKGGKRDSGRGTQRSEHFREERVSCKRRERPSGLKFKYDVECVDDALV
jgi:hypothetical protein